MPKPKLTLKIKIVRLSFDIHRSVLSGLVVNNLASNHRLSPLFGLDPNKWAMFEGLSKYNHGCGTGPVILTLPETGKTTRVSKWYMYEILL